MSRNVPGIGRETVTAIRALLQVDDRGSIETERGFAWWAYRTRQEIEAHPVEGEPEDARIVVRTEHLSPPTADADAVGRALARMNGRTTGGAFRQAADGSIVHELTLRVAADTDWVAQAAATCAMLALSQGGRVAAEEAPGLGSDPLEAAHPASGPRPWPDEMLRLDDQLLIPLGREPSFFERPDESRLAIDLVNRGVGFSADTSGTDGVMCEVGFGDANSTFVAVRPTRDAPPLRGMPGNEPDPTFGHGLIAWIVLPLALDLAQADRLAARLNAAEVDAVGTATGPMHLGAWTVWDPDGRPTPAYRMFLPNLLGSIMSVANVTLHQCGRALATSRLLHPGVPPLDGPGIARLRMRQLPKAFDLPEPN